MVIVLERGAHGQLIHINLKVIFDIRYFKTKEITIIGPQNKSEQTPIIFFIG